MADNITAPAAGAVLATKEIGGVQFPKSLLTDFVGADVLGLVDPTPAPTTLLGRLKAIADAVTAQSGYVDGLEALAGTLNGYVETLETLTGTTNTTLATISGYVDGLEGLIGSTNALIAAQSGYVDGLEALAGAATPAGENVIGKVGGLTAIAGATITRPADTVPYVSGDLVSFSTVAGTVNATPTPIAAARVNGGTGAIRRIRLSTNKTGLAGTEVFRVHLFKTAPTVANGDNGALSVNGVAAIHLGICDITLDRVFSDGSKGVAVPTVGSEILFEAATGTTNIFALLEARGAYTPVSGEVFTIACEVMRD